MGHGDTPCSHPQADHCGLPGRERCYPADGTGYSSCGFRCCGERVERICSLHPPEIPGLSATASLRKALTEPEQGSRSPRSLSTQEVFSCSSQCLYDVEPFRMELAHRNSKFIDGCFDHVHHGVRTTDEVVVFSAVYRQTPFQDFHSWIAFFSLPVF